MFIFQAIIEIIISVINFLEYLFIGYIILGWFVFFGAVKNREGFFFRVYVFLMSKIEPILAVIRKFLPPVAGFDFSLLVIFLGLHLAKVMLVRLFYLFIYG